MRVASRLLSERWLRVHPMMLQRFRRRAARMRRRLSRAFVTLVVVVLTGGISGGSVCGVSGRAWGGVGSAATW
ncbi:Uncharacterised protein [Mycobacteroides abscessus subsp. abscessus]|nr:Uncharacterised protein [Mycobacteroides abscessus subsp. abscessus]